MNNKIDQEVSEHCDKTDITGRNLVNTAGEARGWAYKQALKNGLHQLDDNKVYYYDTLGAYGGSLVGLTIEQTGKEIKELWENSPDHQLYELEQEWQKRSNTANDLYVAPQQTAGQQTLTITTKTPDGLRHQWTVSFGIDSRQPSRVEQRIEFSPGSNVFMETRYPGTNSIPEDVRNDLNAFPWELLK